jgi:hypothetical protein
VIRAEQRISSGPVELAERYAVLRSPLSGIIISVALAWGCAGTCVLARGCVRLSDILSWRHVSSPSVPIQAATPPKARAAERRANRRYPITLQLQYKLIRKGRVQRLGLGRTINISSHGVLFETDDAVPTSGQMELAMNWPFLLQGSRALKLIMRGRILRMQEKTVALKMEFREFRTAGRSPVQEPPVVH